MRLRVFARLVVAAGAVFLAAPAFAQANLTVALTAPAGINVGATSDYKVVITNTGTADATNVILTVGALPAPLTFATFKGCTPTGTPQECTIATIPSGAGNTATVSFSVEYPNPATRPATCNTGETVGAVDVSVVADGITTPATASVASTPVHEIDDVTVAVTPSTTSLSSGGTESVNVVVTNNGPCVADAVTMDLSYPTALGFSSVTGSATFCAADTLDAALTGGGCAMGDLAVGESRSFDAVFQLASIPSDIIKAKYPFAVSAAAATASDWNPDDNAGEAPGWYSHSNSGCSTGGAGTLLALLPLAALRFRRRRSS